MDIKQMSGCNTTTETTTETVKKLLEIINFKQKQYQDFTSDKILPKNVLLRFFPIHSIQPPYTVKWQITNTGNEAKLVGGLRGDKFEDSELRLNGILCGKKESTSYTGMHYIQCFIIKNGNQCVGMSKPFVVNIQQ